MTTPRSRCSSATKARVTSTSGTPSTISLTNTTGEHDNPPLFVYLSWFWSSLGWIRHVFAASTYTTRWTMRTGSRGHWRYKWWILYQKRGNLYQKREKFCIKNEEFCIKNEEICIKNEDFLRSKTRNLYQGFVNQTMLTCTGMPSPGSGGHIMVRILFTNVVLPAACKTAVLFLLADVFIGNADLRPPPYDGRCQWPQRCDFNRRILISYSRIRICWPGILISCWKTADFITKSYDFITKSIIQARSSLR